MLPPCLCRCRRAVRITWPSACLFIFRISLFVRIFSIVLATSAMARNHFGPMRFQATAHSVEGITAQGTVAHEGVVAADPTVLPLGSRIRVSGAGSYSGVYAVTDTGAKVTARQIDIYLRNGAGGPPAHAPAAEPSCCRMG